MNIGWPEGIYLAFVLVATGWSIANHGKPRTGKQNGLASILGGLIVFGLLWWGGFFA